MSLQPLYDSSSVDDKSLSLYVNTLTLDTVNCVNLNAINYPSNTRYLFEPNFTSALINFTNLRSCQSGINAPYAWVLEEDNVSATISGQFQMTGNAISESIIFSLPTSYDANNNNNICVLSNGRSRDIINNPSGTSYSIYKSDIVLQNGLPELRLYWRSLTNDLDVVSDDKFFYFTATYKK